MSDPQPLFSVTLTADELVHLVAAYRFMRHESEMSSAFDALNAAKPVRATKPRAPRAVAEPFTPNTGNAAVDEFMRRKHDPKWKPKAPKMGPGLPPLKPLKVSETDAAEAAWKSACDEARAVVADGKPSDAERELRALIAIHRTPWRIEAIDGPARILTSPRHPGVAIHEIRERGSFGSGKADSTTWRVVAGGELSEKVHYAARAAEIEADDLVLALT